MTLALLLGTLLALSALAFVLYPLFIDPEPVSVRVAGKHRRSGAARFDDAGRDDPIGALREIEFDRETGKLSDSDYESLKARYTQRALVELRARDASDTRAERMVEEVGASGAAPDSEDDVAESLVRRMRGERNSCPDCGPRPEPDARYCSDCGRFLPGSCRSCGSQITEAGARYCTNCGESLAA